MPRPCNAVEHVRTARSALWTADGWMPRAEGRDLMAHVMKDLALDRHPEIMMHGQRVRMRRSVGFFSNAAVGGYMFSGQVTPVQPLTPALEGLLARVNAGFSTDFNGLLINLYADGTETIGAHCDSRQGLAKDGSVAALSLGAERKFRVRPLGAKGKDASVTVQTRHGQLLMMQGAFQEEFSHEVPKELKVLGPRVSITFRTHRTKGA